MQGSPFEKLKPVGKLVLAAGHGGRDTGATNGAHTERDQAMYLVERIASRLYGALPPNTVVIAPHEHDTHESIPWLNARHHWGEAWAVEIHRDSSDTIQEPDASYRCGIYHGTSELSRQIADHVRGALCLCGAHRSTWSRPDTDSTHTRLGWIRQPRALSHLLELGFMEGRNDQPHLNRLADMAAAALLSAFDGRILTL